jgi:hypothetical protein
MKISNQKPYQNIIKVFIACFILYSNTALTETLKKFESDGCSIFPNGTSEQNQLWLSCCQQHDYEYWKGGTYDDREKSDQKLKQCVAAVGEPEIALLMLAGVRVGGSPFFPTKFRWGYGWSYPRAYGKLTEEEIEQVKKLSPKKIESN